MKAGHFVECRGDTQGCQGKSVADAMTVPLIDI